MKKLLVITLIGSALSSFAYAGNYGIPRPVKTPGGVHKAPGIGVFEQNQALVSRILGYLGWDHNTQLEETGKTIKDLLLNKVRKDKEVKDYMITLDNYFRSAAYQKLTDAQKKRDITTAKIAVKMYIADDANSENQYHTNGATK